ncbi:hypothetical protein F4801DRAFT_520283 [Xylaria longipes]|nr:hypothetical protein F4801DRAFT_520283 [Xylaria longipes]
MIPPSYVVATVIRGCVCCCKVFCFREKICLFPPFFSIGFKSAVTGICFSFVGWLGAKTATRLNARKDFASSCWSSVHARKLEAVVWPVRCKLRAVWTVGCGLFYFVIGGRGVGIKLFSIRDL